MLHMYVVGNPKENFKSDNTHQMKIKTSPTVVANSTHDMQNVLHICVCSSKCEYLIHMF